MSVRSEHLFTFLAMLGVAACSGTERPGDARPPRTPAEATSRPLPAAPAEPRRATTGGPDFSAMELDATSWDTVLPAPSREELLWATLLEDGRVAAMTSTGPMVLNGDRWLPATSLVLSRPTEDAFAVGDDCHIVRRRDRRDFGQPRPHPAHGRERCTDRERAHRVYADAAGRPIAMVGPRRRLLRFSARREVMEHTSGAGGVRGYFARDRGPGWQPVNLDVPHVIAVLPTSPPSVVGRDGDVVQIVSGMDYDRGQPVVTVARPRPLAALELATGSLLLVRADGLTLLTEGTPRPVQLDDAGRRWLEATTRRVAAGSASRFLLVALGAERALLASETELLFVDGLTARHRRLDAVGEIWGLVATDTSGGWVGLTHIGRVLRGDGPRVETVGTLTEVSGPDSSHPIGAFRGADGRARLLDFRRRIVCAPDTGLQACGPALDLRLRAQHVLHDGLLIDDQSVRTHLVDQAGSREVPMALPRLRHAYYGGRSDHLLTLSDGVVQLLRGDEWRPVAELPEGAEPLWFTVTPSGAALVGLHGGQVIGRALEAPAGGWL